MARKGTAAGRSGEEKTGGPGGVLRCAGAWPGPEPGLGVPRAARAGEKTRGGGVKGAAGKGGDACAGCGCGRCPGGVSSMPNAAAAPPGIGGGARIWRGWRGRGPWPWGARLGSENWGSGRRMRRGKVGDGLRRDRICPPARVNRIESTSLRLDRGSLLVGVRGFPGLRVGVEHSACCRPASVPSFLPFAGAEDGSTQVNGHLYFLRAMQGVPGIEVASPLVRPP